MKCSFEHGIKAKPCFEAVLLNDERLHFQQKKRYCLEDYSVVAETADNSIKRDLMQSADHVII
jgi:hypothetical protein